jgi:Tfp pilus assembly protein PilE
MTLIELFTSALVLVLLIAIAMWAWSRLAER